MEQGLFDIIESFAILKRGEFYIIGNLKEGKVQEGWFINIAFNPSLALSLRIASIEDVIISNDEMNYKLLIIRTDKETMDLLLALKIGAEYANISIEGKD
ncbi:hypothetical protein [Flavobacterium beibuense]|uniref:Uncharacterized protein n=1 Tax=Flavobacterium beibuense TaxID=657326 RepID=A0A444WAU3_9FLAO|nr:hypothetical protein [Flavobacterium beibuense]RYJ42941.1 hypothetical protein NU09_2040 [Flavobacterium beibuense]